MKKMWAPTFAALLVLTFLPAASTSASERSSSFAAPIFSKVLYRNVTPTFQVSETQKHKLAVLEIGKLPNPIPEEGYSVPFVVRNGTSYPVGDLQGSGTIWSPTGKVVGSGSDQGFVPTRLLPGQDAFAYIYLSPGTSVPAGSTIKVSVSSQKSSSPNTYFADLQVVTANNTGMQIVGLVRNPRQHSVQGPGTVIAYCVSSSGNVMGEPVSDVPNIPESGLNAGATASFTIGLYGAKCPSFIIGSSAFDFKYIGN